MGEFGPTLTANEACTLPEGSVKVVGHGGHVLSRHLEVEVTAAGETETQQWHDEDVVGVGQGVYIVNFIHFDDFTTGVPVAHLVLAGEQDDPEFQKAELRSNEVEVTGFVP